MQNIPLVNSQGAHTGITVSTTNFYGGFAAIQGVSQTPNPELTTQYLFDSGPAVPATIVISGLVPLNSYDLYVYSSMDPSNYNGPPNHGPRPALISANGQGPYYVSANPTATAFIAGVNYAPFLDVVADQTGSITTPVPTTEGQTSNSENEVDINGFQIYAIAAEPSSVVLSIFGVSFMIFIFMAKSGKLWLLPQSIYSHLLSPSFAGIPSGKT